MTKATLALALLAFTPLAPAQQEQPAGEPALEEEKRLPFLVELTGRYVQHTEADLDEGGDFSMQRANARTRFFVPLSERFIFDTEIAYELSHYDFGGGGFGIAAQDPWSTTNNMHIRPLAVAMIHDDFALLGGPIIDYSGESGADFYDSITFGWIGAFRWQVSESFAFGLGLQISDRLEDSTAFYPTFILNWQVTDRLLVRNTDFNLGAAGGTGAEAMYDLTDRLSVGAGFQAQIREFRLDENGVAPNGVGREVTYPVYARIDWSPTPKVMVSGFAGAFTGGSLQLKDSNGFKLHDEDYNTNFGFGLQVRGRF
jgi:hypothetical protein